MDRLGVGQSKLKPLAAVLGERVGRLKLNGQLRGYSPLSRLDELELLQIGVAGKRRLWRALEHTHAGDLPGFELAALAERATEQAQVPRGPAPEGRRPGSVAARFCFAPGGKDPKRPRGAVLPLTPRQSRNPDARRARE